MYRHITEGPEREETSPSWKGRDKRQLPEESVINSSSRISVQRVGEDSSLWGKLEVASSGGRLM